MITRIFLVLLSFVVTQRGRDFHESPESLPQESEKSFPFIRDDRACFAEASVSRIREKTSEKGLVIPPSRGLGQGTLQIHRDSHRFYDAIFSRLLL
jgi:hypothetical protein